MAATQLFYFERKVYASNYQLGTNEKAGIVAARNIKAARAKLDKHFDLNNNGNKWTKSDELGPTRHYKNVPNNKVSGINYVALIESTISASKTIPAGRYLICDPCYLELEQETDGSIITPKAIATASTGGDGGHKDNHYRTFSVDSGRISVFDADKYKVPTSEYIGDLGHLIEFKKAWQLIIVKDGTGNYPVQYNTI